MKFITRCIVEDGSNLQPFSITCEFVSAMCRLAS